MATVLLITRKFPPSVGGMEEYSFHLHRQMRRHHRVFKISLGHSQLHLIWFVPLAVITGMVLCRIHKITHIHMGDVLLAPVGLLLAKASGLPLSITAYGLDVLYDQPWYQWMVRRYLPRYRTLICISKATRDACVVRGVDPSDCHVVPCGVDGHAPDIAISREAARKKLLEEAQVRLDGTLVLLTVGRLVPRKGVAWFIESVLPCLPSEVEYIVVGGGPEEKQIREAASQVSQRVLILGAVSSAVLGLVYASCDVFVMPNRSIEGDMEGFGIVAIEAGMHGTPVVASGIDGITDAVLHGRTGLLVDHVDPKAFVDGIREAESWNRQGIARLVLDTFSWEAVYRAYAKALQLNS